MSVLQGLAQSAEAMLGGGVVLLLVAVMLSMLRSRVLDPKMLLLIRLMKDFPR
jgi:hypothetical protein